MPTRLANLVIDCPRPRPAAEFWSALLGWQVTEERPGEVSLRAPRTDGCELGLSFAAVPEPGPGKGRIHLDLSSGTAAAQKATVDRAIELGASRADIGQGEVPWEVLADPAGHEFCVLEPRPRYMSSGALAAIVVETADPMALAAFWAQTGGWLIGDREPELVALRSPTGRGPWLEFLHGNDNGDTNDSGGTNDSNGTVSGTAVPCRSRLELAPLSGHDITEESTLLLGLGAQRVPEAGDPNHPRIFTDPGGNEFRLRDSG